MTQEQDVVVACSKGVDAIGLIFYEKSPRCVSIAQASHLIDIARPFTTTVGVVVNGGTDYVEKIIRETNVDIIQFHGDESPEFCQSFSRPYYKALRVSSDMKVGDVIEYVRQYQHASAILLDTYSKSAYGGTGEAFNWDIISSLRNEINLPIILAGGLTADNASEAITKVQPYALDVNSGVELSPGIKSHDEINRLYASIK